MNYNYTAYYKTDDERINAIKEDILREYPRLGELAEDAAKMETPFGRVHEDYDGFSSEENHINRLIDIVILTENKPEYLLEYKKACGDLLLNFKYWQNGFTYANPEEQAVYILIQRFNEHLDNISIPLLTYGEALTIARNENEKKESSGRAI